MPTSGLESPKQFDEIGNNFRHVPLAIVDKVQLFFYCSRLHGGANCLDPENQLQVFPDYP